VSRISDSVPSSLNDARYLSTSAFLNAGRSVVGFEGSALEVLSFSCGVVGEAGYPWDSKNADVRGCSASRECGGGVWRSGIIGWLSMTISGSEEDS